MLSPQIAPPSVLLYHFTSPASAIQILEKKVYQPASTAPLNNDNGLNCFRREKDYRMGQAFEGSGVRLLLEWTGPVVITDQAESPPLALDVLHDQHPWRCFIRGGTKCGKLHIVGIEFETEVPRDCLGLPWWHKCLSKAFQETRERTAREDLLASIQNECAGKPLLKVLG